MPLVYFPMVQVCIVKLARFPWLGSRLLDEHNGEKCQGQPRVANGFYHGRFRLRSGRATAKKARPPLTVELEQCAPCRTRFGTSMHVDETLDTVASKVSLPNNRGQIFEMAQQLRQGVASNVWYNMGRA